MGQIIGSGYFIEINKDNLEFKYGEKFLDQVKENGWIGSLLNKFKNTETKHLEKIIEYLINNSSKNRRIDQINSFGKIVDLKESYFTENDILLFYYSPLPNSLAPYLVSFLYYTSDFSKYFFSEIFEL